MTELLDRIPARGRFSSPFTPDHSPVNPPLPPLTIDFTPPFGVATSFIVQSELDST
jgi:hypothetical protein